MDKSKLIEAVRLDSEINSLAQVRKALTRDECSICKSSNGKWVVRLSVLQNYELDDALTTKLRLLIYDIIDSIDNSMAEKQNEFEKL